MTDSIMREKKLGNPDRLETIFEEELSGLSVSMPTIQDVNSKHASVHSSRKASSADPFENPRSHSIVKFTEDSTAGASLIMRRELNRLIEGVPSEDKRKSFEREMDNFYSLFIRFLQSQGERLEWGKIKSPSPEMIVPYEELETPDAVVEKALLQKLAVVKLNGGLGTTMGCVGPKSAIEVRDGMTFLDLTVRQIEWLNQNRDVDVPLLLMNSFNTDSETEQVIQKYHRHRVTIRTFNQSRFPRIDKESLLPLPQSATDRKETWYPPGHGDIFNSLYNSGLLDELEEHGIEYLFISNVDNLGATVNMPILHRLATKDTEFIMEVTEKTRADVKGGTLIDYDGHVSLLEIAQVPTEHKADFTSIKKFKIFNTNNIWVSVKALKRLLQENLLSLDVITNNKTLDNGKKIIQLETATGSAIKHFPTAQGIIVPRSRFLPVKNCSDLFLVQSDLYTLVHGELVTNPKRQFQSVPLIKLGEHFKKVPNYLSRFAGPVHILELDHLTVTGDVYFGENVSLKGTVIIVADHGCRIDIPAGSVLEDKVVTGNLHIMDH